VHVETCVESAWLQRLKVYYDTLLSNDAFETNLRPYKLVINAPATSPQGGGTDYMAGRGGVENPHSTDVQSKSTTPPPRGSLRASTPPMLITHLRLLFLLLRCH